MRLRGTIPLHYYSGRTKYQREVIRESIPRTGTAASVKEAMSHAGRLATAFNCHYCVGFATDGKIVWKWGTEDLQGDDIRVIKELKPWRRHRRRWNRKEGTR